MRDRRNKRRRPGRRENRPTPPVLRDRPTNARRRLWLLGTSFATCVAVSVSLIVLWRNHRPQPQPQPTVPAPETAPAPAYLNTGPDARYVGIDTCAECHRANHTS